MAYHAVLAAGRWFKLTLAEQLGNVGSEVSRMGNWKDKNQKLYLKAFERALELLDLTIADLRWKNGLKELTRARELLCDAMQGGKEYGTTFEDLNRYFFQFALAARQDK